MGEVANARRVAEAVLQVDVGYGKLLATGSLARSLQRVPGAAWNEGRKRMEVPLHLDSVRAVTRLVGVERLRGAATPAFAGWARAARLSHEAAEAVLARLEAGERATLPWADTARGLAPWAHQELMASLAVWSTGAAILGDTGTGKTRAAIEAIRCWRDTGAIRAALVVLPKKVQKNWREEVPRWSGGTLRTIEKGTRTIKAYADEVRQVLRGEAPPACILISYQGLDALMKAVPEREWRDFALVGDESHRWKNPHAIMTKAAFFLAPRATRRLLMTGTPVLNSLLDAWSQWFVVDFGVSLGASFVAYRTEHFTAHPFTGELSLMPESAPVITARMAPRMVIVNKQHCMSLPDRVYMTQRCELTPEQQKVYAELSTQALAKLDDLTVEAAFTLVRDLRLSQLTSGYLTDDETGIVRRFTPNPKLDLLAEIVAEEIDTQQILVWAHYRENIHMIAERLAALGPVAVLLGGMSDKAGDAAIDRFQSGAARVLVSTQGAGGTGLNLQAASLAIYYSQSYNFEHRAQSEGRNFRGGSDVHTRVTYIDLIAEGTVDEDVVNGLRNKLALHEYVQRVKDRLRAAAGR